MQFSCVACRIVQSSATSPERCFRCRPLRAKIEHARNVCKGCEHFSQEFGKNKCDLFTKPCDVEKVWLGKKECLEGKHEDLVSVPRSTPHSILGAFQPYDCRAPDDVAILTPHFNHSGFRSLVDTYTVWMEKMGTLASLVHPWESYAGAPELPGSTAIKTDSDQILWQKEALLNAALRALPRKIKWVAWIDHDLLQENRNWLADAIAKLKRGAFAVQLFSHMGMLTKGGAGGFRRPSTAYTFRSSGKLEYNAPGGAWMMGRDDLDAMGGLYDLDIVGGGDVPFARSCMGDSGVRITIEQMSSAYKESRQDWWSRANVVRAGRTIDYVEGTSYHLWHGERKNRQYQSRHRILSQHQYDPGTDVIRDESGLLRFAGNKPVMQAEIARYFADRRDDG